VHRDEPSAERGHVHVGGPRDVRVLAPSARLGDGRIDVLFAIVFERSVTMEVDRIGIQVSFPLDSDGLQDPPVLRAS